MKDNPNNIVKVPYGNDEEFFKFWMLFLKPYHFLTENEMAVTAALLCARYELSQKITDNELLDEVLFSEPTRKRVREFLGMTSTNLQWILTKLRKTGVIINERLNPKYVPNYNGDGSFRLLVMFEKKPEEKENGKGESNQ